VTETCERKDIWLVQTPQVFRFNDIMAAHERAISEGWDDVTDDASLTKGSEYP
jgi:2-C-methyl-D-erythritol 4-phosphate cytidylyltransferase